MTNPIISSECHVYVRHRDMKSCEQSHGMSYEIKVGVDIFCPQSRYCRIKYLVYSLRTNL